MLTQLKIVEKLNKVTNDLAEQIKLIREAMTGRGILPADAPLTQMRMKEIEDKLRKIGSNPDDIVPFN